MEDFYKGQEKQYAEFSRKSFAWEYLEKPSLDKHLSDLYSRNPRVLEAGCGNGRIVEHFLERGISADNIVGIDLSEGMLTIAKKDNPSVRFIHADITQPESIGDTFDLVTCSMVLEGLGHKTFRRALNNFAQWLRKGGNLLYIVPHPIRMTHGKLYEYFNKINRLEPSPWNTQVPYTHRTMSDYINETILAGLTIMSIDEPEIPKKAAEVDPEEYENYTASPARLVVMART